MPETTQQLKSDIDTGRTGDKIDQGYDPGLASLGTDDEAGGTPNTPAQVQMARALESAGPAAPEGQGARGGRRGWPAVWMVAAALLIVVAAIALAAWSGRAG